MSSDADAAALYDVLNAWDGAVNESDAFYDALVAEAEAVLDVGCGTGSMLHRARDAGHTGRLVGLDPDVAMLARARRRADVEWVPGTAADATWDREFDLATMVSHAFQCLVTDDELARSLAAIRAALVPGGRFAFETRHPQARAWEQWVTRGDSVVTDARGRLLAMSYRVEAVVADVVTFVERTSTADGELLRADRATLRFLDVPTLSRFVTEAGFTIDGQYGDWLRGPVTRTSSEIVTIARRR